MSKELELIAKAMQGVATEGHKGAPGARDDGQLWGAFPNTMTVHDLAAHVVSRLSEHGYSIVQTDGPAQQLLVEFDYRSDGGPKRVGIFSSRLDAESYVKSLGPIDAEWCVAPVAAAAAEEDTNA